MDDTLQKALRAYAEALRVAGAAEEGAERYFNTHNRVIWEIANADRNAAVAARDAALRALNTEIMRTGFGAGV
jgi:hypothetical protein